jgi:hypothetical protein
MANNEFVDRIRAQVARRRVEQHPALSPRHRQLLEERRAREAAEAERRAREGGGP